VSAEPVVDVLVAGAGLPGLAVASALARQGISVALCDRAAVRAPEAHPDDWDARVYAVSPGSAAFLATLSAWQALSCERMAPVDAMDVQGDTGGRITFSAYELGTRALAWIVEERQLRAALVESVHAAGVQVVAPAGFSQIEFAADKATLTFDDGTRLHAQLVVGADGLTSWVRSSAGIAGVQSAYEQTAVVANFTTARDPLGVARQWFLGRDGVLAWLPLPGRRISIVWSAPTEEARALLALSAADLAGRVAAAGGHELGELTLLTPAAAFPLSFLKLPTMIGPRLALIGDAAHGIHPLAGQGVNLGFGDAAALSEILAERGPITDVGSALLLERYGRRRAEPVLAVQAVTHGLARLFDVDQAWVAELRNRGMSIIDRFSVLKRALAQPVLR
jgi:2-octaprenylphenol hydroxylase